MSSSTTRARSSGALDQSVDGLAVRARLWRNGNIVATVTDGSGPGDGWTTSNLNLPDGLTYRLQLCTVDSGTIESCSERIDVTS